MSADQPPTAPFELRYDLNRRQRLIPHLRIWGPVGLLFLAGPPVLLASALVNTWWVALGLVPLLWVGQAFYTGVLDVILHPVRPMDVRIEEQALGILFGSQRG